ncbi:rad21 Cohesin subunit rad21 [Candida maltosa Xu316]|uniref:Uncharacterized protein n=1 Tax=Candida maltosa (strain Xu316) TaxID=1245528 RepID=M3K1M4_CANMX|nr:hypothetical protein G210_0131 [Candida maltosa Xu316]
MVPESIISKQGPLGHVWLAANYDKKLTKQQLMNTNIVKSTEYITNHPIVNETPVSQEQTSESTDTITLRLSGQLLLGIVKIYSRKTKYLLDDVNDILYKLKASFKLSSGVNLGSDNISVEVNLPTQQTILSNLASITLRDEVTSADLLRQDDLDLTNLLGDSSNAVTDLGGILSQAAAAAAQSSHQNLDFDRSLEFPRFEDETMTPGPHDDFELDFDLNLDDDNSIEVGRDASVGIGGDEREMSVLGDLDTTRTKGNIFDIDFGQPSEALNETETLDVQTTEESEQQQQPLEPTRPPRQKRTRITDDGEIITNNRRLVVDSEENMEGIPVQQLRENQERVLRGQNTNQYITLNLSDFEKLKLIEELSLPVATKRRKLWNLDAELQYRAAELALVEEQQQQEEEHNFSFDNNFDDNSMDFDLDLPAFDEPAAAAAADAELVSDELSDDENTTNNTARATEQIAEELVGLFKESDTVSFAKLVETDSKIHQETLDKLPLGVVNRNKDAVNSKKEASKCFFELLVLATNDCITINQNPQETMIAGDITVRSRDRLYTNFI